MFAIDPSIIDLKVKDRNLFKVLFSMNNHQVANPEMSLEEARSYVFFCKDAGKVQAYVGLYFIPSDRRMYYTHSSNPFPESELAGVEEEARNFAEDLGAMLDEIEFSGMSAEDRHSWIDAQEMLSPKKREPEAAPAPAVEPAASAPAASDDAPAAVVPAALVEQPFAPAPAAVAQSAPVQPSPVPVAPRPAAPAAAPADPLHPARAMVQPPLAPAEPRTQPAAAPAAKVQPSAPPEPVVSDKAVPVDVDEANPSPVELPPARRQRAVPAQAPAAAQTADEPERPGQPGSIDAVLDEAVRAGVVKAPKAQLKKDIRSTTGAITREKEALARLLSSF